MNNNLVVQSGILKRSFLSHPDLELSEQSQKWLQQCPDAKNMVTYLRNSSLLSKITKCSECGEKCVVGDMRVDDWTSFPSGKLICEDCAKFFCQPTLGDDVGLDFNENWKPYLPIEDLVDDDDDKKQKEEISLVIQWKTTKEKIGTVKHYNPRSHTGLVLLDAFEENEELGSLDWNCEVVTEAGVVVGPTGKQPNPMKGVVEPNEIAYQITLEEALSQKKRGAS